MKRGILTAIFLILSLSTIVIVSSQLKSNEESLPFIRGDVNIDGIVDLKDASFLLSYFYGEHDNLLCEDAADVDDDGIVNMNDAMLLIDHIINENTENIPSPNNKGEDDLTSDNLKC